MEEPVKTETEVFIAPGTDLNKEAVPNDAEVILAKYAHLQITDSTPIPPPVVVVKISGEDISSEGAITAISGASKSGKSALSGIVIAGAIAPGSYDDLPGLEIKPADGRAVVHFDSEQARHKHQRNLISILKRAGLEKCPDNLLSYNIREADIKNYCRITEEIVAAAAAKFNHVHMIVIDGGADYIYDVNEPNQSNALVKFFEDVAIQYRTPVLIIVHTNPGGEKERGHFGSQLQRKCESVLTVKTQGDISCLEPRFLRNAGKSDIPLMQFRYDKEKRYHVYCGLKPAEEQGSKDVQRIQKLQELAQEVFTPPISLHYNDAVSQIMKHSKREERTAKNMFKEMRAHEMIEQDADNNWHLKKDKMQDDNFEI